MVKEGACVIDVGITRIKTSEGKVKLVGDVDFNGENLIHQSNSNVIVTICFIAVREVAGHITPVPGGVGPVTVAMLMKNTFEAAIDHLRK